MADNLETVKRKIRIIKARTRNFFDWLVYRRKQVAGEELIHGPGRGLYVVGLPDHCYFDGCFYRLCGTVRQVSLQRSDRCRTADLGLKGIRKAVLCRKSGSEFRSRGSFIA